MASTGTDLPSRINRRTIRRGLVAFLSLAIGGLALNFLLGENRDLRSLFHIVRWRYLGIIFVGMGLDLSLSGYRLYIFGKPMVPHTTMWDYVRANLANIFAAGLTPSQTGGGPAQIYILQRAGVPVSASLAFSIINLFSTLLFFFVGAWVAIAMNPGIYPGSLNSLVQYGFLAFSIAMLLFVLFIFRPEWGLYGLRWLVKKLAPLSRRLVRLLNRGLTQLDKMVHDYKDHLVHFTARNPGLVIKSLITTVVLYFNKFVIAYFIARMLGASPPFWHLMFVQMIQFFIIYFAPTPGAGGIAEISASGLMAAVMSKQDTAYFALLWRLFTLYIAFIVGGIVMMRQLHQDLEVQDEGSHTGYGQ